MLPYYYILRKEEKRKQREIKDITIIKEEIKLSLLADDNGCLYKCHKIITNTNELF